MRTTTDKLSRRQIRIQYGFNDNYLKTLINHDRLSYLEEDRKQPRISRNEVESLRRGKDYIICQDCGSWTSEITTRHLSSEKCESSCSNLSEYKDTFENFPVRSKLCEKSKGRSERTKKKQSQTMKRYYKTEKGKRHREAISKASKKRMEEGYQEKAAKHLRSLNQREDVKQNRREETLRRWEEGELRNVVESWHRENREESKRLAAYAREHIDSRESELHQKFKVKMEERGIEGFETEFECEWYSIDEALPSIKLALEIDGCYWHSCPKCGFNGPEETEHYDKKKESFLLNRNWWILRFWGHEVLNRTTECLDVVESVVDHCREVRNVTKWKQEGKDS